MKKMNAMKKVCDVKKMKIMTINKWINRWLNKVNKWKNENSMKNNLIQSFKFAESRNKSIWRRQHQIFVWIQQVDICE